VTVIMNAVIHDFLAILSFDILERPATIPMKLVEVAIGFMIAMKAVSVVKAKVRSSVFIVDCIFDWGIFIRRN